jgi:hypothetical protein
VGTQSPAPQAKFCQSNICKGKICQPPDPNAIGPILSSHSSAICAATTEKVIENTDIDIDSVVPIASTSQGRQNPGSPMETDVCDEEGSATRTEQKSGQRLKSAAKNTESPKIAEKSNVGPLTRAAVEEVHRKRAVAKKKKKSKQTPPILDFANETIHTINLLMLTMLVHTSEDCLLCQPAANYRALRITALKEEQFIMAMIKPNKDIMEEMYAFLYEVTPVQTEHTLPIYQTYKTYEGQTQLKSWKISLQHFLLICH